LPKRQAQRLEKEYKALEMYYIQQEKRGKIAKALKLTPEEVTKIVEKFKRDVNKVVALMGEENP
jgi:DNA-binding transcriptional regulator LsrR (DeoR family)